MENNLTLWNFNAGCNIKTEVCMRTADPQVTMQWIKEVEIAKSIDELVPSQPDFHILDAMIASALRKLINSLIHFRKRVVSKNSELKIPTDSYEEDKLHT